MPKRDDSVDESALELLLDTICNTFGGVIFISMLVALLLSQTTEVSSDLTPEDVQQEKLVELKIMHDELLSKLKNLNVAASMQTRVFENLVSADAIIAARKLQQEERSHKELVVQSAETTHDLAEAQSEVNRIVTEMDERKKEIKKREKDLEQLQTQLSKEIENRSRSSRISLASDTQKREKVYFLKGGKLYGPSRISVNAYGREKDNIADFRVVNGEVEVNATGGVTVDKNNANTPGLKDKLSQVDASEYYVKIFVWPDSFGHWKNVRDVMVELNILHQLRACKKDSVITLGPPGKSNKKVMGG